MKRRMFLGGLAAGAAGLTLLGRALAEERQFPGGEKTADALFAGEIGTVDKSEAEWREQLSADAFDVLREEGTEAPGSSPLNQVKDAGTFVCAACDLALFKSDWKFESGTGWPSFYTYIDGHLGFKVDRRLFMARTEYHCARCGGHQGHVFEDGPEPTGLRYCNNGVALKFMPADETTAG